jgi:ADP-heptose:LPS heptosyltransferase
VLAERYQLREFLGVLAAGDLLIGPSTGPLHMAAALGVTTVGLFPPVATMSARRWGPRGPFSRTLEPDVSCPASRFCIEERCLLFNCMQGIFVPDVVAAARAALAQRAAAGAGAHGTNDHDLPRVKE